MISEQELNELSEAELLDYMYCIEYFLEYSFVNNSLLLRLVSLYTHLDEEYRFREIDKERKDKEKENEIK